MARGEAGHDDPAAPCDEAIAAVLLDLARRRGAGASFCPSEAARALAGNAGGDWRVLMPRVRESAAEMVATGRIEAVRRGRPVCPLQPGGPFRLRLPRHAPDDPSGTA